MGGVNAAETARVGLAGAEIILKDDPAHETATLAAIELRRYLLLLTGEVCAERDTPGAERVTIVLTTDVRAAQSFGVSCADLGDGGFILRLVNRKTLIIAAEQPVGLLYGVYTLAEHMGAGFWLGGDTFPDRGDANAGAVPATLDETHRPSFAVRGNLLHYNFLAGCTTWGLADYKFYFDQLAKTRCNLLLIHWYDGEPGAASEVNGEYLAGGAATSTLSKHWGGVGDKRTRDFSFGTGEFFDEEIFGSPMAEQARDVHDEIRLNERMFVEATRYARRLGVGVAAGFKAPRGSPVDATVRSHFVARLEQFLKRNPELTYLALWEHESGGSVGSTMPTPGSESWALLEKRRAMFEYLGAPKRVWEAIRFGGFAEIAYEVMRRVAPKLKLVLVGWGGDRWMQFADYCLGYDKLLPGDVVFTCHENIDASISTSVSNAWGKLPPQRQRWAIPWIEGDLNDCWTRQPNVESLGSLAPDALKKGCQGLLTLHWRTRDVEEEAGFIARFAWDPTLTPARLYRLFARHAFGVDHERDMGDCIERLQKLGARWTGVAGPVECGSMKWTGWEPHIPFRLDVGCIEQLRFFAQRASDSLAELREGDADDAEGMFHLHVNRAASSQFGRDENRIGVREFKAAVERLSALIEPARRREVERVRGALREIEESIFLLRPALVHAGMPARCHPAVDEFLIHCHHVTRHGEVEPHFAALREIRAELSRLRDSFVAADKTGRIEPMDFLLGTMNYLLHFDAVSLMLARGGEFYQGEFDRAAAQAKAASDAGDKQGASEIAGAMYSKLADAGMHRALQALTRRLTVRGDWGVLASVNVKAMPVYWDSIAALEAFLLLPPPRAVHARNDGGEVLVQWSRPMSGHGSIEIAGSRLFRSDDGGTWKQIGREVLRLGTTMFVDRGADGGVCEYAVASVDAKGVAGPMSHAASVRTGRGVAPRIVACKPACVIEAGAATGVRVVVIANADVRVRVHYRRAGDEQWSVSPMFNRFRRSYQGEIPGSATAGFAGVLLWFVEAVDREGGRSVWPATADEGVPWSAGVVPV